MQQTVCIGYVTSAWQGELKTDHVTYIHSKQMAVVIPQRVEQLRRMLEYHINEQNIDGLYRVYAYHRPTQPTCHKSHYRAIIKIYDVLNTTVNTICIKEECQLDPIITDMTRFRYLSIIN